MLLGPPASKHVELMVLESHFLRKKTTFEWFSHVRSNLDIFLCFHVKERYLSFNLQYIFRIYMKYVQKYVILSKGSQFWIATQISVINIWQILRHKNGHFDHFTGSKIWLCGICSLLDAWKVQILKFWSSINVQCLVLETQNTWNWFHVKSE